MNGETWEPRSVADWEAVLVHYMSDGRYPDTAEELAQRGWTDDEIHALLDPALRPIERRLITRCLADSRDRQVAELGALLDKGRAGVMERRAARGRPTLRVVPRPNDQTPLAPVEAEEYRKTVRELRRGPYRGRRVAMTAIAARMGRDRGTIPRWIKLGRIEPPEDVPER